MQERKKGGLLPNSRFGSRQRILCCDRVFLALCHDMAFHVATWLSMSLHGPQAKHMTRPRRMRLRCARERQSFFALCRDRVLRVVTWFPGMLGGLGHDRGFLCRDRVFFFALCRDRNFVSRQDLGLG